MNTFIATFRVKKIITNKCHEVFLGKQNFVKFLYDKFSLKKYEFYCFLYFM